MKKAERSKVINLSFHLKNLVKEKQEETLLPLLSRFSHVRLCATPETAAHQAPPSLGFSRQEHWSGLPFPSPMYESVKWKWCCSVVSDSSRPHGPQPTRLLRPWDFPGKGTGVAATAFSVPSGDQIVIASPWPLLPLSHLLSDILSSLLQRLLWFKILNFITYLMWLLPYKLIHSQVLVIKTKTSWEVILPTRKANYQNGYPKK